MMPPAGRRGQPGGAIARASPPLRERRRRAHSTHCAGLHCA
ncbi:hypothetical protein GLE_1793 [Lysobacter enzymogenes]|uniref:Uncharacterized protein n=1 Tax=Lysobacter enzymogenes TaxID=69 RepID=A0A0S2DF50_LYSEN|nr:hypothetical protein GLE_1793 [Lysobacter enzymogenes]